MMSYSAEHAGKLAFFDSALFHDVQMAGVFSDSKTFADAVPKQSYQHAMEAYSQAAKSDEVDLTAFVKAHFDVPPDPEEPEVRTHQSAADYIATLWQALSRKPMAASSDSLLALPEPYIVPGGRFREIYYWDTYFTSLGLVQADRQHLVSSMFNNFLSMQDSLGLIPNGNRSYYCTRSQPPVMSLMAKLLLEEKGSEADKATLSPIVNGLLREHAFWMAGEQTLVSPGTQSRRVVRLPDGTVLNRYWDDADGPRPESYREDVEAAAHLDASRRRQYYRDIRAACESGWDFSSRWMSNPASLESIQTTRIVPVDLNCLMYSLEQHLSALLTKLNQKADAAVFAKRAEQRREAISSLCWSEYHGTFMDLDSGTGEHTSTLSLAGVLPLFCGIASQAQAAQVAALIEKRFLKQGGLVTTLTHSDQQWDSPNGWAPLHWFVVKGLLQYGYRDLADTIARRWMNTVEAYFQQSGFIMEKYDVEHPDKPATGGEYQVQHGFGWTNGVMSALQALIEG